MEDLNQQIDQILSDPQSVQKLQAMASALGLGGPAPQSDVKPSPAPAEVTQNAAQPAGPDLSALAGILGSLGGGNPSPEPPRQAPSGVTPEILRLVSRLAPLLSQMDREDDSTRLLHALRPLLSQARQQKLDEAVRILQTMRLLPLLRESGLLSGLLPGL